MGKLKTLLFLSILASPVSASVITTCDPDSCVSPDGLLRAGPSLEGATYSGLGTTILSVQVDAQAEAYQVSSKAGSSPYRVSISVRSSLDLNLSTDGPERAGYLLFSGPGEDVDYDYAGSANATVTIPGYSQFCQNNAICADLPAKIPFTLGVPFALSVRANAFAAAGAQTPLPADGSAQVSFAMSVEDALTGQLVDIDVPSTSVVPEPGYTLLTGAFLGLVGWSRRIKKCPVEELAPPGLRGKKNQTCLVAPAVVSAATAAR